MNKKKNKHEIKGKGAVKDKETAPLSHEGEIDLPTGEKGQAPLSWEGRQSLR